MYPVPSSGVITATASVTATVSEAQGSTVLTRHSGSINMNLELNAGCLYMYTLGIRFYKTVRSRFCEKYKEKFWAQRTALATWFCYM
jgi:hypothetical protein